MQTVGDRNWDELTHAYFGQAPRHVVLDDFLTAEAAALLHAQLLEHWGWRKKNWVSAHLHNHTPRIPVCALICEEFAMAARKLLGEMQVCDYWALLYPNNTKGNVHADAGKMTLTIWLTPDEHNLAPETGGLLLFDVNRHPSQLMREYLIPPASAEYVQRHSEGKHTRIPYRCNRAVLFDATTFHRTDDLNFNVAAGAHAARMNLSMAFDNPADYHAQFHPTREKHVA